MSSIGIPKKTGGSYSQVFWEYTELHMQHVQSEPSKLMWQFSNILNNRVLWSSWNHEFGLFVTTMCQNLPVIALTCSLLKENIPSEPLRLVPWTSGKSKS